MFYLGIVLHKDHSFATVINDIGNTDSQQGLPHVKGEGHNSRCIVSVGIKRVFP